MLGPRPKKDSSAEERSRRSGKLREKRKTMLEDRVEEGTMRMVWVCLMRLSWMRVGVGIEDCCLSFDRE